jgi:hypothetical protein
MTPLARIYDVVYILYKLGVVDGNQTISLRLSLTLEKFEKTTERLAEKMKASKK